MRRERTPNVEGEKKRCRQKRGRVFLSFLVSNLFTHSEKTHADQGKQGKAERKRRREVRKERLPGVKPKPPLLPRKVGTLKVGSSS